MNKKIVAITLIILSTKNLSAQNNSETNKTYEMKQNNNTFINPPGLFDASKNGFSHIAIKDADAELVFISGQWASNENGELQVKDFEGQVQQSIKNLKTALAAINLTEKDIIKMTIYIADYTPQKKMQLMHAAAPLLSLEVFPASTIVPVPVLATHPESLIEIEAIATK